MDILVETINKYENIIIAKHKSPDWDAHGSAHGLKHILLNNFKNKKIFVVGWDIENKAVEPDELTLSEEIITKSLLITVDVANYDRIDFDRIDLVKNIFKVDHHIEVDNFAKDKLVDSTAIACTQVITLWAKENSLKIPKEAAYYLYYGLITDSARFLYKNTSSKTFEAAKVLTEQDIDIIKIYENLYLKNFEQAKWNSKCFQKIITLCNKKIAYLKIKKKYFKNKKLSEHEIKSSLSIFVNIKEIEIWYIAYQKKDSKSIKVSIRSRKYDVNKVANEFGGGGHILASGLTLKNWNEIKVLNNKLKELINEDK
ncbi:DHH family protein [Spiroplasma litorale]|uniref:DHH family protein n=1 Tax=Spiroplasma litorale TaxID=216942 RepID=A0A0K1W3A9_9MOLU|nr:bifunctional oligoribonuclease/PAP phosphatase NrnA [Spiroplasma litorale]AKX34676.1 DHH family protein [Spiroplasma litorale]